MKVDPKTLDLAEHFLAGSAFATKKNAQALAEVFQAAAEHFMSGLAEAAS